jgi:hypothetical protein
MKVGFYIKECPVCFTEFCTNSYVQITCSYKCSYKRSKQLQNKESAYEIRKIDTTPDMPGGEEYINKEANKDIIKRRAGRLNNFSPRYTIFGTRYIG